MIIIREGLKQKMNQDIKRLILMKNDQVWTMALRKRWTILYICSKLSMIYRELLAPVTTTLPDTKIKKAILGFFSL